LGAAASTYSEKVDNSLDVGRYLHGVSYPATKQQLVGWAHANHANAELLEALRNLRDAEYVSASAVSHALRGAIS
jgi:Protein of unknown function (DUF2795)